MWLVWRDAQKLDVNTAVPWAYPGIHASNDDYYSSSDLVVACLHAPVKFKFMSTSGHSQNMLTEAQNIYTNSR